MTKIILCFVGNIWLGELCMEWRIVVKFGLILSTWSRKTLISTPSFSDHFTFQFRFSSYVYFMKNAQGLSIIVYFSNRFCIKDYITPIGFFLAVVVLLYAFEATNSQDLQTCADFSNN